MTKPNGHSDAPIKPPVIHQMLITFNETSDELTAQGIPLNKLTALRMLTVTAQLVLNQQEPKPDEGRIIVPPGVRLL